MTVRITEGDFGRRVTCDAMKVDRRKKPPIASESVGIPLAVDSLAELVLRRLAARERPNLTLVTDEQSSGSLSQVFERP